MQHAGQHDVIGVDRRARDLACPIDLAHARADDAGAGLLRGAGCTRQGVVCGTRTPLLQQRAQPGFIECVRRLPSAKILRSH